MRSLTTVNDIIIYLICVYYNRVLYNHIFAKHTVFVLSIFYTLDMHLKQFYELRGFIVIMYK